MTTLTAGGILAHNIQTLRVAAGMTQEALAEKLREAGFSIYQSSIYKLEALPEPGRKLTFEEGIALARIFGVDVARLLAPVGSEDDRWKMLEISAGELADSIHTLRSVLEWTRSRIDKTAEIAQQIPESESPVSRRELLANLHPSIRGAIVSLEDAIAKNGHPIKSTTPYVETISVADENGEWHDVPVTDIEN